MIDTKEDNKTEINLNVNLTKSQLSTVKRFIGLANSTDDKTALKALIMAVGRGSIGKSY